MPTSGDTGSNPTTGSVAPVEPLYTSPLRISRRLAYFFGVVTPLAETVRRWGTWWDNPPAFVDDYLLGAFLIAGALMTRNARSVRGRTLLAGAWGFACGMAYSSAAFHWFVMRSGEVDPAPIPTEWVFGIKVVGGLIFVGALVLTITAPRELIYEEGTWHHAGSS
jgi:hypothetical protein